MQKKPQFKLGLPVISKLMKILSANWQLKKTEIFLLLAFVLFNFILFIPRYLFDFQSSDFLPLETILNESSIYRMLITSIGWRFNYDPFRFCIDYFLVLMIISFVRKIKITLGASIITVYYLIIFTYQIYFSAFEGIYHIKPLIFNDVNYIKLGFQILKSDMGLAIILLPIFITGIGYLFFKAHSWLIRVIRSERFSYWSFSISIVLLVISLANSLRYGFNSSSENVFQWVSGNFADNVQRSRLALNDLEKFDYDTFLNKNEAQQFSLTQKPNIHFLAIESYGRVIYDDTTLLNSIKTQLEEMDYQLKTNNWGLPPL